MSTPLEHAKRILSEGEPFGKNGFRAYRLAKALVAANKDTERLEAFFGGKVKYDINIFMQGVREGWSVDKWREFLDAAMKGPA